MDAEAVRVWRSLRGLIQRLTFVNIAAYEIFHDYQLNFHQFCGSAKVCWYVINKETRAAC
jgi:hypothetical protein